MQINSSDNAILLAAVRAWTGWGKSILPLQDDEAVKISLGNDLGSRMLPVVYTLAEEFYITDARHIADNIAEISELAAAQFNIKYPDLPSEIGKIFAWCYSFDFK